MSNDTSDVNVNIGCTPLLAVFTILLVLKLAGVVDWSWWIITAPLWVVPALYAAILGGMLLFALVVFLIALPFIIWDEMR